MSDSIPIIIRVLPKGDLVNVFGNEIGSLLARNDCPIRSDVRADASQGKSIGEAKKTLVAYRVPLSRFSLEDEDAVYALSLR